MRGSRACAWCGVDIEIAVFEAKPSARLCETCGLRYKDMTTEERSRIPWASLARARRVRRLLEGTRSNRRE